jgi:ferredoxin-nitrite reductase
VTEFTEQQKRWLEGFTSGLAARKAAAAQAAPAPAAQPVGPDALQHAAQDRAAAAGGKLTTEEKAKRQRHPLDRWDEIVGRAEAGQFPKGVDVLLTKWHGLFYVAPAEDSFMCRLRIPNGILSSGQMRGLAEAADSFGGGYADVTTRANLQIREIAARHAVDMLLAVQEIGITARGSGADNIRNITGSATAGIDPQELIDTRPLCRAMHHYILNHREMYGLPRKFNIAFDGGGKVPVLEDTNDIGFVAARASDGVYFRLQLGGITGHLDFAHETGVLLKPEECVKVAGAVVRVFIAHGDRTNRTKARLKYVLDRMGRDEFLKEVEKEYGAPLRRAAGITLEPRPMADKHGHIGVHAQKQAGLNWIGVVFPVGKITVTQMRGLAKIAHDLGDGDIRLTVWQNLLISGVPDDKVALAEAAIRALGLTTKASPLRAGLISCTGSTGCRFAAAHTKENAEEIVAWCEPRVTLDQPVNIHLTGCHHSCAQHYIGDIGLIAARVAVNEEGDTVDGYHVLVGGGFGPEARLARDIYSEVKAEDAPRTVERILKGYLAHRDGEETFLAFSKRHETDALKAMFDAEAAE